jgi:hypothetical protein
MKSKMVILGLISILCLTYNVAAASKQEAASKQFDVQFVVPVTNELTNQVKSYGTRELRALHDVKLIHADPTHSAYLISIYPLLLTLSNGETTGVVVSYVIEKDHIIQHAVMTGPTDQLEFLVEKIIADFDTYWLEPKRHK